MSVIDTEFTTTVTGIWDEPAGLYWGEVEVESAQCLVDMGVGNLVEALVNYGYYGRPLGGFLTAVVENDLSAVVKADPRSLSALPDLVRFVYCNLPSKCWGSPAKVKKWSQAQFNVA